MEPMEWKEPIKIPNGEYNGEITKVEEIEKPYKYTNVFVKVDNIEGDIELKYGCPSILSEGSKLGKLCISLGAKFIPKEKLDVEKILKNKRVKFMTLMKEGKDGKEYAEIVEGSIKPEIVEEKV